MTSANPHKAYRVLQDGPDRLLAELPNRLIVLAAETHTAPVVSVQAWVKTGSIYEQEYVGAGLSHFLEHLISGGSTSTRTEAQSNTILGQIGAQTNAATSLDTVHYYINTASTYAHTAIDLLSDWMQNSLITQREYDRERSVVQREFEMGQGEPNRIMWKLTQQARYNTHPARHPTIGYLDQFLKISRNDIYDFYKRMYVPNNIIFVVVGDVDKQQVVQQIATLWADAAPSPLPTIEFPIETAQGTRALNGTADIDNPRLRLAWPGTRLGGEGDYALDLLAQILGQGESSRLVRTVRDQQRVVNTISSYNASFPWGEGFFGIDAEIAAKNAAVTEDPEPRSAPWVREAKTAILAQVKRIVNHGVTGPELARAKRKTMASVIYSAQSAQALASRMARDLIGMKNPDYLNQYAQAIQAVTADEIQEAAAKFLQASNLICITLLPHPTGQKPVPLARPAENPASSTTAVQNVPLDNAALAEQLLGLAPNRQNHDQTATDVQKIERYVLPNGMRLLVGRSSIVPAVALQMYQRGGLLSDPQGREGLANAMAAMRIKGTGSRTAQQIAQEIEDLGASLTSECGNNSIYSKAVCLSEDWDNTLALLADVTMNPIFPDDQWAKMQPRLIAAIERQTDTWYGELRQHFRRAYFGSHPWATSPLGRREVIESLTAEDLRAFHRKNLAASESVLVVFGDVEPHQVITRVRKLFDTLPEHSDRSFSPVRPTVPQSGVFQFKTSKPLAAVQIGFGPTVDRRSTDYAALAVLTGVLSRFPSGWLEQELRGRGPGLVYAVGAGQFTGLVPGYFAVLFNTQTDAVEESIKRCQTVMARTRNMTVDASSLAAAKAKILTEEFLYKQTNSQRAADAALNELYDLGLDEPEKFRRNVEALDGDQIQAAAAKYLRNPVAVIINHAPTPTQALRDAVFAPQGPTNKNEHTITK